MNQILDDQEKEILECMLSAWIAQDMPLYGNLSVQCVIDLMDKFGVDKNPIDAHPLLQTKSEK